MFQEINEKELIEVDGGVGVGLTIAFCVSCAVLGGVIAAAEHSN